MDQARIKLTLANSNSLNQSDIFVSNAARQGTPANETVSQCLCEGVQRPKQSHALLVEQGVATPCSVKIATTPERRFAMTNEDCDTVSFAGMTILLVLCSYAKLSS